MKVVFTVDWTEGEAVSGSAGSTMYLSQYLSVDLIRLLVPLNHILFKNAQLISSK